MIRVLADSSLDGALIAKTVGGSARAVNNADRFTSGDARVECLVLSCRHPIRPGRIQLLCEIERKAPWLPLILVTDPEPESMRKLGAVRVTDIVWFKDLRTELQRRVELAQRSTPLLRLAEQLAGSTLPPALRCALAHSLRAATDQPVRNVKALAAAVRYSPITLSKQYSGCQSGATTLSRCLSALVILRARHLYSLDLGWKSVGAQVGFSRETLQRKSKRWKGCTLGQLAKVSPDQLLHALVSQYLRPLLGTRRGNR